MSASEAGTDLSAQRLRELPPYLFAEIDRKRDEAVRRGVDVIDLGVGDPDLRPPEPIIERLCRAVKESDAHRYSSYSGTPELRRAFAEWFERRFGVSLDPDEEVLPLIGSKEGIGHIALALVNPGEEVLIPDPGYPVYRAGTVFAGGRPVVLPLRAENGFLPDLDELAGLINERTKLLWLNYPSNPTTAMADLGLFERVAALARERGVVVCHDSAYCELAFEEDAPSFLQAEGGLDVAVEFHSLSKTFCMPGWRVGFAAGRRDAIAALARIKRNLDSGIFKPLQAAAAEAVLSCTGQARALLDVYRARRDRFVGGLRKAGWDVPTPKATFYVWAPVPGGRSSAEFAALLLERAGVVCTPGVGFGRFGEGFVRMSLTAPDEQIDAAVERISEAGVL